MALVKRRGRRRALMRKRRGRQWALMMMRKQRDLMVVMKINKWRDAAQIKRERCTAKEDLPVELCNLPVEAVRRGFPSPCYP